MIDKIRFALLTALSLAIRC